MTQPREAHLTRRTSETEITLSVSLDGDGTGEIVTGVGFFDHMLTHVARHGLLHLTVQASGDLHIDDHHTVEDVGIALGQALREAVGDKAGIARYGFSLVPMDEALVSCALDWSGRGLLVHDFAFSAPKIGAFDTELVARVLPGRRRQRRPDPALRAAARAPTPTTSPRPRSRPSGAPWTWRSGGTSASGAFPARKGHSDPCRTAQPPRRSPSRAPSPPIWRTGIGAVLFSLVGDPRLWAWPRRRHQTPDLLPVLVVPFVGLLRSPCCCR